MPRRMYLYLSVDRQLVLVETRMALGEDSFSAMSIKVLHRMALLKKLVRLSHVAPYNRYSNRYLPLPGSGNNETEEFRLRNGQVVEVKRDARIILNEMCRRDRQRAGDQRGRQWEPRLAPVPALRLLQ
jgi:hypothetical protein